MKRTEVFNYQSSDWKGKTPELVKSLGLFLENGVIKCRGSLEKSELKLTTKLPILLPSKNHLTNLLHECHRSLHGGVDKTLHEVRSEFWIP